MYHSGVVCWEWGKLEKVGGVTGTLLSSQFCCELITVLKTKVY